jgi:hypothetical protein
MFGNVKALIVVLLIAATVFRLAKPIALQFISEDDFLRRRLVWFILTAVSFLSPSFWLYALVAVPVLIWANRRDSSAIGLYLMLLHVVSPVGVEIPILGNNGLFPLDNYRLLAIVVLLPAIIRYRKNLAKDGAPQIRSMDVMLLAFGVLQVALYTPPDSRLADQRTTSGRTLFSRHIRRLFRLLTNVPVAPPDRGLRGHFLPGYLDNGGLGCI